MLSENAKGHLARLVSLADLARSRMSEHVKLEGPLMKFRKCVPLCDDDDWEATTHVLVKTLEVASLTMVEDGKMWRVCKRGSVELYIFIIVSLLRAGGW